MAYTIPSQRTDVIELADYIDHVQHRVNLRDLESVANSAGLLKALANDRTLVVTRLNELVERAYKGGSLPSAQAVVLGSGENFYVRAAIWPSRTEVAGGHLYQDQFAYNEAHDHNFSFLTVNYLGSGYETEIYEYDYEEVEGFVGERVNMRFLERTRFGSNSVMLYRAGRDIHTQHPPDDLSITLNLMVSLPEYRLRDQFYFDVVHHQITACPALQDNSKRVSLLRIAGLMGNGKTEELLDALSRQHPCRRSRLAAFESLEALAPQNRAAIWQRACGDAAPLVVHEAERRLAAI